MTSTYLTVEEAAKELKVHEYTLRRWLREGVVKGQKFGRVWRVPVEALRVRQKGEVA